MQLSVPSVRLTPSLDDVQRAINRSAVAVIGCSKQLWQWGQLHLPDLGPDGEQLKTSYFDVLGCDLEIIKVALLLTGALHGTRNEISKYLQTFKRYD